MRVIRADEGEEAAVLSALSLPLESERLLLRDFVEDDWRAVHGYSSDPEVVRFMVWGPNDEAQTHAFIKRMLAQPVQQPRSAYELAVVRKADGQLIGACGLRLRSVEDREGDIGYVFSRAAWGQGYATEAARTMIDAGFRQAGLHRIYATCDPRNLASARVLEKSGMQREGRLRQHKLAKGAWRDSLLYAVLE